MSEGTVNILVQSGGIGLALVALGIVYYCVRVLTNHLTHVAEILGRVAASLEHLERKLD